MFFVMGITWIGDIITWALSWALGPQNVLGVSLHFFKNEKKTLILLFEINKIRTLKTNLKLSNLITVCIYGFLIKKSLVCLIFAKIRQTKQFTFIGLYNYNFEKTFGLD